MSRRKIIKKIDNPIKYDLHLIIFADSLFKRSKKKNKKRIKKEAENCK